MAERIYKLEFKLQALFSNRGEIMYQIKKYCKEQGLTIEVIDNGGFLLTKYHITVEGPQSKMIQFQSDIKQWADKMGIS